MVMGTGIKGRDILSKKSLSSMLQSPSRMGEFLAEYMGQSGRKGIGQTLANRYFSGDVAIARHMPELIDDLYNEGRGTKAFRDWWEARNVGRPEVARAIVFAVEQAKPDAAVRDPELASLRSALAKLGGEKVDLADRCRELTEHLEEIVAERVKDALAERGPDAQATATRLASDLAAETKKRKDAEAQSEHRLQTIDKLTKQHKAASIKATDLDVDLSTAKKRAECAHEKLKSAQTETNEAVAEAGRLRTLVEARDDMVSGLRADVRRELELRNAAERDLTVAASETRRLNGDLMKATAREKAAQTKVGDLDKRLAAALLECDHLKRTRDPLPHRAAARVIELQRAPKPPERWEPEAKTEASRLLTELVKQGLMSVDDALDRARQADGR